jgi:hypothetical protein
MRPYADIQTDRLRAVLRERKKACCQSCVDGQTCEKKAVVADKAVEDRAFIDRVVGRMTAKG